MELIDRLHKNLGTTGLLLTTATTLVVGFVSAYHLHLCTKRNGEIPINWSWIPLLGNAIEMGSKPIEFLTEASSKHPDVFGIVVAGQRMFIISDPHSSHLVLKPAKTLSWEVFHNLVLENFFGATNMEEINHKIDEPLMRKLYSTHLLRCVSPCFVIRFLLFSL
jgi:hypothetical protein